MKSLTLLPACLIVLISANIACSGSDAPCFAPASLILDPRVLAVRADPPMAYVDPTGADPIAPVRIAALVVNAAYGSFGEYGRAAQVKVLHTVIHVCLPPSVNVINAQPGCPDGSAQIGELDIVPDVDTPFVYTPPLALLQQAIAADPVHGLGGVQLRIQLDMTADNVALRASKTLYFLLKGSPATLNHSLVLTGTETSNAGVHSTFGAFQPVDIFVARTTGLRPLIGPAPGQTDAVETYLAYDNNGVLTQFREHVTYAFYAGNALFFGQSSAGAAIYNGAAGDVADEPAPGVDPTDGLVSVEPVYPGNQGGTYWVVARDDRGAVTWAGEQYYAAELREECLAAERSQKCPVALYGCN